MTRCSAVPSGAGQIITSLHFFAVVRMANTTLPISIQMKGLLLSQQNEVMIFIMNKVVGDIYTREAASIEIWELKCTGSREEFVCTAFGYLCNPSAFMSHGLLST